MFTITNKYLFDIYIYIFIKKKYSCVLLNINHSINIKNDKISHILISYIRLDIKLDKCFCINKQINIIDIIDKNKNLIIEEIILNNNQIITTTINYNLIDKINNSECIMCLENKLNSNNYFQCLFCKNKFLCYNCFLLLQNNNNLKNKCIVCYKDYIN